MLLWFYDQIVRPPKFNSNTSPLQLSRPAAPAVGVDDHALEYLAAPQGPSPTRSARLIHDGAVRVGWELLLPTQALRRGIGSVRIHWYMKKSAPHFSTYSLQEWIAVIRAAVIISRGRAALCLGRLWYFQRVSPARSAAPTVRQATICQPHHRGER